MLGSLSVAVLIGGILFGGIGFAAFVYGKKQADAQSLILGIALMVYPFFVTQTILFYVIGTALTAALFLFR